MLTITATRLLLTHQLLITVNYFTLHFCSKNSWYVFSNRNCRLRKKTMLLLLKFILPVQQGTILCAKNYTVVEVEQFSFF